MAPVPRRRSRLALTETEREEISRGLASAQSLRTIAHRLRRAPSTISREIQRNGGGGRYRAQRADRRAWAHARRPKRCRLAGRPRLRAAVASKLACQWSPQQIAGWLRRTFPSDADMHVSHETIYRSLFVQSRGVLKRELLQHLRQRQRFRHARAATRQGHHRGRIPDAVSIRERPAEVIDRAVPGHWEGDLLLGAGHQSQVATLVERQSRYVILVRLPEKTTQTVVRALAARDPAIADRVTEVAHLGSRHRTDRASRLHDRHASAGLLLRSPQSVATGVERKHQWPATAIPTERHRSLYLYASAARCHRASPQHSAAADIGLSHASR